MSVYAVHYTWVEGHATHGPVGIWNAEGDSYYPVVTASQASSGAGHVLPIIAKQTGHTFESWLQTKSETTGTNTNWSRIDSESSMQEVLDALQDEFFAHDHSVKTWVSADAPATDESDEGSLKDEAMLEPVPFPAGRRVNAESWWIASELAARHPEHFVYEVHPGGGMYDNLSLMIPGRAEVIRINRGGSLTVGEFDVPEKLRLSWAEIMADPSPHGVVKRVEVAAGLVLGSSRPPTTRRTVVYRFIASFLAAQLNDRHTWDCRNEFRDSSDYDGGPQGYITRFPAAEAALGRVEPAGLPAEPHSHFWALLRGDEAVAILSLDGTLFEGTRVIDLFSAYEQTRSITAVVGSTMNAYLR